ncbi:hypothetical protein SNE40_021760 [Patella caerulea]|uniref:Uncharacterized protein n=1 Tax=Patella caerulea TaxID=87958 RepID=A0AAN8G533_PATCE
MVDGLFSRAGMIQIKSKFIMAFVLMLLILICGDVEMNPGPSRRTQKSTIHEDTGANEVSSETTMMEILKRVERELGEVKSNVVQLSSLQGVGTSLAQTVSSLHTDIQSLNSSNQTRDEENSSLKESVENLERKLESIENEARQKNLVINGLKARNNEECEKVVEAFIYEKLNVSEQVDIEKAYLVNKKQTIIVKLWNLRDKNRIIQAAKNMRSEEFHVSCDYSFKVRQIRKKLIPYMLRARESGKKASLKFDRLIIDGELFTLDDLDSE